jgi:predicted ATPase
MIDQERSIHTEELNLMSNQLILPSLAIRQFRIFRKLEIERLGRVNLIVGKNNVGKTSVLEALTLYANPGNPEVLRWTRSPPGMNSTNHRFPSQTAAAQRPSRSRRSFMEERQPPIMLRQFPSAPSALNIKLFILK